MLLSVSELRIHAIDIDRTFAEGEIDCRQVGLQSIGPIHVTGQVRMSGPQIRVKLQLDGRVDPLCARCLEVATVQIHEDANLVYHPAGDLNGEHEVEIHTADTEVGFFEGQGVELEDIVREQVLLALPLRSICKEDCKGLCPACGKNLNQGQCDCPTAIDPRWEALAAHKREPS